MIMEFITDNLIWVVIGGIVILMTFIGYLAEKTDFGRKSMERRELRAKAKAELKEKIRQEKIDKQLQKEKELAAKADAEVKVMDVPKEPDDGIRSKKKKKKEKEVQQPETAPVEPTPSINIPLTEDLNAPLDSTAIPVIPAVTNVELAPMENTPVAEDLNVPLEPAILPVIPAVEQLAPTVEPVATEPVIENPVEVFSPEVEVAPIAPTVEDPVETLATPIPENVAAPTEPLSPVEVMEINPTIDANNMPQDISNIIPQNAPLPDISTLQNNPVSTEEVAEEDDVWKF